MATVIRIHQPTSRRQKTPAEEIQEMRSNHLARAVREGWGRHVSDVVVGDTVFMHFERGRAEYRLPSGSNY